MKNKILAALVAASCCVSANAADTYKIDPNHTAAIFAFQHFGFSTFRGKIPAQSGAITIDPAAKTGSAEVVFDIKAIATGVPKFDAHLKSEDFFEADKYPTATFKATNFTFDGDAPSTITGDLTIKGITKPVTLKVTSFKCADHPMMKVPACGANATAKIKRTDFDVGLYAPNVSDEIELDIEVEAMQQK
jgi:polyisoprenoid-binding protein YceI